MKSFSVKIKQLRQARGMSLRQTAEALAELDCHVSHTAIARWERPGKEPNLPQRKMVFAIAKLFNVSTGWLLEDLYEPPKGVQNITTRQQQFSDINLLDEKSYRALLSVKNELLRLRSPNNPRTSDEDGQMR